MNRNQPLEADWKHYKSMVHGWRERYLSKRNVEVVAILNRDTETPTTNFWDAHERMQEIERVLEDGLGDQRRSRMFGSLLLMHSHQMISDSDLDGFREELRARILSVTEDRGQDSPASS